MRTVVMGCIITCGYVLPELLPAVYAGLVVDVLTASGRWGELMTTE